VHADTWGPYPVEGYDGTKLFLFMTDDFTRFTICERLKARAGSRTPSGDSPNGIQRVHQWSIGTFHSTSTSTSPSWARRLHDHQHGLLQVLDR
jgi:hypothetical protein